MDRLDLSRRGFVAGSAVVAVLGAPALAAGAPAPPAAPGTFDTVPYTFDVAAFTAVLDQPYAHRQLVAATSFAQATNALAFMTNSIKAYADPIGFNAGPRSLHVAGVFYHGPSALLALDDAMYAKYPIAELTGAATGAADRTNVHAADYRDLVAQHGASFFVCNNALSGLAGSLAQKIAPAQAAVTREQVVALHDEMVAHFLPGTLLVPAGVAAINAAQEARFTFLPA